MVVAAALLIGVWAGYAAIELLGEVWVPLQLGAVTELKVWLGGILAPGDLAEGIRPIRARPGVRLLRITANECLPYEAWIDVRRDRTGPMAVPLVTKLATGLVVGMRREPPTGATMTLRNLGTAASAGGKSEQDLHPGLNEVPAGRYLVRARAKGYRTFEKTVEVVVDQQTMVKVRWKCREVTVTFKLPANATLGRLQVDGTVYPVDPNAPALTLGPGCHGVTVDYTEGGVAKRATKEVQVPKSDCTVDIP